MQMQLKIHLQINVTYFGNKEIYCFLDICCITFVLFSTKCCSFHNFIFLCCSYNMFFINHALKFKYQPCHLKVNKSEFSCLEMTLTHQRCMHDEIKSKLNLGNGCYCLVQKLLSFCLLSKNMKIKIYGIIILSVVLYGCETLRPTLREEHRLKVF
jgi:hypothetical protein